MSAAAEGDAAPAAEADLPAFDGEDAPLSSAQERFWFLEQLEPGNPAHHVAGCLHLEGGLNVSAFERALAQVVARHDALRTTFPAADGRPRAQVEDLPAPPLEVVDLPLPCLITVQTGLNEVRYASLKGIMQAKKKPLDQKGLSDLGLDAAAVASKVTVDKLYVPEKGEGAEILEGSAGEVSQQLVGKIKELGLL